MKKLVYNDRLEKVLTALFGTVGTIAILVNLSFKGYTYENIFDAIKDVSSLIIAIAVFLVANKVFSLNLFKKKFDFNSKFEEYLIEWADNNKHLIDVSNIDKEKGKERKRTIEMICDHENFVKGTLYASDIKDKGAFLYLPLKEEFGSDKNQIIQFKINKGMFQHKKDFNYEQEKNIILGNIADRINGEFNSVGIRARRSSESERVDVDFADLEKTSENAKRLIDVVEFVKTLFLAIA